MLTALNIRRSNISLTIILTVKHKCDTCNACFHPLHKYFKLHYLVWGFEILQHSSELLLSLELGPLHNLSTIMQVEMIAKRK